MCISMSTLVFEPIIMLPGEERRMFIRWHAVDPVFQGDRDRDVRVKNVQWNGNPRVQ